MKASKSAVGLKTSTTQHIYEYEAATKKVENAYEEKKSECETKDDKLSNRSGGEISDERKYGDSINLNLDISRTNNIMNESHNLNLAESVNEVDEETADLTKIYSQKSGSTMSKSSKSMNMNATSSTLARAAHGHQV